MRRVVRCARCSLCASWLPAGFTSTEHMRCTSFCVDVEPEDGCTFGERGEPQRGFVPYDVTVDKGMYSYEED